MCAIDSIISVHFPKAAGSSLNEIFKRIFPGQIYDYYWDDPLDPLSPRNIDPDRYFHAPLPDLDLTMFKIIHGHFHINKFQNLRNSFRMTFLRHPVDNIISIYLYWKATASHPNHAIHSYVVKNNLSIIDVAGIPAIRYLMSRTYFGDVDMGGFDFIGCFENRSSDLQRLADIFAVRFDEAIKVNTTRYPEQKLAMKEEKSLISKLSCLLREDIRFYEKYAT